MNCNTETKRIGFYETVYETTAEQSLEAEINLPDYCPEIRRILKCTVTANVASLQNNSGRLTTDVNALIRFIYVGENGNIASYEQNTPIQKYVESSAVTPDCAADVRVNTDFVNCRAVNSRRVDIRAMLTFIFKAVKRRDEKLLCSAGGSGIQTMSDPCDFASLAAVCSRTFAMSEVIELGAEKSPVAQVLNISAFAVPSEVKLISNKALVKGECGVKIFYIGEGSAAIESIDHSMPISQIIELDGINETSIPSLNMNVCSCEAVAKADSSGEMRLIDLNVRISTEAAAFENLPVSFITDAYSTECDVQSARKSIELLTYNDSFDSVFTNKVVLESIGVSVDCILSVWCGELRKNFSCKDGKCLITGTYNVTVIYKDSDSQIGMIQKPVDFDYSAALHDSAERINCYGGVQILACSCAVTGESRLEIKTEMKARGIVLSCCVRKYISDITLVENTGDKEANCALTIYYSDCGESVWDIAKRYHTTVDAIKNENDISSDRVENGGMLLIPCAK